MPLDATYYTDPGCPWAYSANPALTVLRWRYSEQLRWRLVVIGLTERHEQYEARGYTPAMMAMGYRLFGRRYGMPVGGGVRERLSATARGCRAIVAARLQAPEREWAVLRALQFAWFTTTRIMDEGEQIAEVLDEVDGIDAQEIVAALDSPEVTDAYERDRAEARTAAGSPTEFQGKAAATDGPVRYTAPSVILSVGDRRLEAGGYQPIEAYDVLMANLDPTLHREPPPDDPLAALQRFPDGLTTQEVAAVLAPHLEDPDRPGAEARLLELVANGKARRRPLGDDALWTATDAG